jgi:3-oxoacyl-[acyl-carrier protein] reductase
VIDTALSGKAVLVTGAAGGIGRALAEAFAAEGASLLLTANAGYDALRAWLAEQPWSGRALAARADVTRPAELSRAAAEGMEHFGRLDACVVNAGVWPPDDLRLDELPEERLRSTIDINLLGALWTVRAFFGALRRTGPRPDGQGASVTFIGSTAGRFGERFHVDYAVTKAALRGAVLSLKNEIILLDPYGRVNMVEPGWTVTPMAEPALAEHGTIQRVLRTTPVRQLARPEDVARAVVFLSSPALARHVSGEILTVAGGMEGRVQWDPDQIDPAQVRARLDEGP